MCRCLIFFSFLISVLTVDRTVAQQSLWVKNPFEHHLFIENKGQFRKTGNTDACDIKFAWISDGMSVYFTPSGLCYYHTEIKPESAEEREREERGGPKKEKGLKGIPQFVNMDWADADPNVKISAENAGDYYFNYADLKDKSGKSSIKASGFKKITYKNIYPDIDIVYTFPSGKQGIKYSIVLHPGANPSLVKMKYSGKMTAGIDPEGDLLIKSPFGDIVDHAPQTFFENGETIPSVFQLQGNTVSFNFKTLNAGPGTVIPSTVVIDPWTTVPTFTGTNSAYDVAYDFQGNVYVCGGTFPWQEIKLNSAGVIQWVYSANPFNATWMNFYGSFAVDAQSESSYLVEGINTGIGAQVIKVNGAGTQLIVFPGNPQLEEMWRIVYNNCNKEAVIAGGGTTQENQACVLDTNLVAITAVNVLSTTEIAHDICLLALDNSNNCYMATTNYGSATWTNQLLKVPAHTLSPMAFMVSDGYDFQEGGSYVSYFSGGSARSNGFNGMAVSDNYLYTYDGAILKKWDKNLGTLLLSQTLSTTTCAWGGLAVDDCNNLYVGYQSSVQQYDSMLVLKATYPVANTVYGLCLGVNSTLDVCGNGFVQSLKISSNCSRGMSLVTNSAGSCSAGSATVTPAGGTAPYTYFWSTGQTTQTVTGLSPGNYFVTVTDASCIRKVQVDSVQVTAGGLTLHLQTSTATCTSVNGTVKVTVTGTSPSYTYNWSTGASSVTAALADSIQGFTGTGYTVTVTDNTGCSGTTSVVLASKAAATLASSGTNVSCNGALTGSVYTTPSGGTPGYTYNWSNGATAQTVTGLGQGTYTVTVTDKSNCSSSSTVSITQPPALIVQPFSSPEACGTKNGIAAVVVSGGSPGYTYLWTNGASGETAANLAAGNYTVTVTDANKCKDSIPIKVPGTGSITAVAGRDTFVCTGKSVQLNASGGINYSWSPATTLSNAAVENPFASPLSTTKYYVTVTAGGCISKDSLLVTVNPLPLVSAGSSATVLSGTGISLDASGGVSYLWRPPVWLSDSTTCNPLFDASAPGVYTYTVIVTDANGCSSENTVSIRVKELNCESDSMLFVPTAFSPNGDGVNDVLYIRVTPCIRSLLFNVFDRWGQEVFQTISAGIGWDGKFNGKACNQDVFVYYVSAILVDGTSITRKGNITLMR